MAYLGIAAAVTLLFFVVDGPSGSGARRSIAFVSLAAVCGGVVVLHAGIRAIMYLRARGKGGSAEPETHGVQEAPAAAAAGAVTQETPRRPMSKRARLFVTAAIGVAAVLGTVAAAYYGGLLRGVLPANVPGLPAADRTTPVIEIGSSSYAWGGGITTVCQDGRVYVSSTGGAGSTDRRGPTYLVAALPQDVVDSLDGALGAVSFDYSESFRTPGAIDGDYAAFAARRRGATVITFEEEDYRHFDALVQQLSESYRARIGAGALSLTLERKEPLYEWPPGSAVDPARFGKAGVGPHEGFTVVDAYLGDLEVTVDISKLSEQELAALASIRAAHAGEFGRDNMMYDGWGDAFFRVSADPATVYQVFMPAGEDGALAGLKLRVKSGVVGFGDIADLYGGSDTLLAEEIGRWERNGSGEYDLIAGSEIKLNRMQKMDRRIYAATTGLFTELRAAVAPSKQAVVTEGVPVCGSPRPDGIIIEDLGARTPAAIVPPEGYAEKANMAQREVESRAGGERTAALGETFNLRFPGDEVRIAGHEVTVRALTTGRFCDEQPAAIDFEFITSDPASCQDENWRDYIETMEAVIGGEVRDVPIPLVTRNYSGITVPAGDKMYRVIVKDYSTEVRVLELMSECAAKTTAVERNQCWFSAASEAHDASLCDRQEGTQETSTEEWRDGCKRIIGIQDRDAGACRSISGAQTRADCLETLAFDDPSLCAEIPSPKASCLCHAMADERARGLCLERTIYSFPFTATSPYGYCDRRPWQAGECALWDIVSGYPVCFERDGEKCVREATSTGIWNCADLDERDVEVKCYREFIRINGTYLARPQGIALCDEIRDEARKARCQDIVRSEKLAE